MIFHRIFSYSILILCTALAFCACSDDSYENGNNPTKKYLPKSISLEGEITSSITTYDYDNSHRLTSIVKKEIYIPGNTWNELSFDISYDASGKISQVVKTTRSISNKRTDSQDSDILSFAYRELEVEIADGNYKNILLLNGAKQVIEMKRFTSDNLLRSTEKYQYDNNGNISGYSLSNGSEDSGDNYTFSYDKGKGIFKDVNIPQWFFIAILSENNNIANNLNKQVLTSPNGQTNTQMILYKYNKDGYPVSETFYYEGYSLAVAAPSTSIEYQIAD